MGFLPVPRAGMATDPMPSISASFRASKVLCLTRLGSISATKIILLQGSVPADVQSTFSGPATANKNLVHNESDTQAHNC